MERKFDTGLIFLTVSVTIMTLCVICQIAFIKAHECVKSHYEVKCCGRHFNHTCLKTVCDKWERK